MMMEKAACLTLRICSTQRINSLNLYESVETPFPDFSSLASNVVALQDFFDA